MEKLSNEPHVEPGDELLDPRPAQTGIASTDWQSRLPVLAAPGFTMRELRTEDAASLMTMLTTHEVARLISPPPTTVAGFERFVDWTHLERAAGNYVCFGIVPAGMSTAIGLFQIRTLEPGFRTAEWGFAIGSAFWGRGLFAEGAQLMLEFAFDTIGVHRLEARAAVANGRGNGALRKIGAVQEGVMRRSFLRNGQYHDQVLWSILADDWRVDQMTHRPLVH